MPEPELTDAQLAHFTREPIERHIDVPELIREHGRPHLCDGAWWTPDDPCLVLQLGIAVRELGREAHALRRGTVLDKDAVRAVLQGLVSGRQFSPGELGIEQATNRLGQLQRAPRSTEDVARTVSCDYCGRTAGNPCHKWGNRRGGPPAVDVPAHPSRLAKALREGSATGAP